MKTTPKEKGKKEKRNNTRHHITSHTFLDRIIFSCSCLWTWDALRSGSSFPHCARPPCSWGHFSLQWWYSYTAAARHSKIVACRLRRSSSSKRNANRCHWLPTVKDEKERMKEKKRGQTTGTPDDDEDHQPPWCVLPLFYRTDGRGQVLYTTPSIKYDGPVKIRVHLLACLFFFRFSIFVYIYLWWDRDDEADRQAVVEGNVSGGMQYDGSGGRSVGILVFNTPTDSAACQIRRFRHIKKKKRRWWFIFFFFFA